MKKKWLSLLLALSLMISLLIIPAQADSQLNGTGTLEGDTATLTISADKTEVAVGAQDVYVTFTVKLTTASDNAHGIPAFSFVLKPSSGLELATQKKADNSAFYYQVDPEGKIGAAAGGISAGEYKYTALAGAETPSRFFGAAGLNGAAGIGAGQNLTVMKIMGKIPANTTGDQTLTVYTDDGATAKDNFTAGIADGDQCKRVVDPVTVRVSSGVAVSGTVTDEGGAPVNGAAMELYMDGEKVADGVTSDSSGQYTFSNVSTGSYTVKAKGSGLSGSVNVTVTDGALTAQDVSMRQYQKGDVDMDGEVDAEDATLVLRHIAHIENITDSTASELADVDNSGAVDAEDATKLLRYIAHIDLTLG